MLLEARTTTDLVRNTVHQQYTGRALGFFMLNHLVPIIIHVRQPGGTHKSAILVWGDSTQKYIPFEDLGEISKDCLKVFLFNVRHYVKCYLNNDNQEPYTYNLCKFCGAKIRDSKGYVRQIAKRKYRADMYIYQPTKALQNEANAQPAFSYQERGR